MPGGGSAVNPVRSERKQRQQLLPGARLSQKYIRRKR